jgi:hypothetical protein
LFSYLGSFGKSRQLGEAIRRKRESTRRIPQVRVHCCNGALTPAGFAEIVGYHFQSVRRFHRL